MTGLQRTIVLVEGTWGGDEWAGPDAPFRALLERQGFTLAPEFTWSENVSGLPRWLTLASREHSDWRAGGYALALLLRDYPQANIIAHSHGGPCVGYACAEFGATVRRLITVATPPRADVDAQVWGKAKPNIGFWLHVTDERSDFMQFLGGLFDRHIGRQYTQQHADRNLELPGIGHSQLLTDPTRFHFWPRLLDAFRFSDDQVTYTDWRVRDGRLVTHVDGAGVV